MTPREAAAPVDDDAPLSLQEAAATLLRGLVRASTLQAAAARHELVVERIGRRYVVTPAEIKRWRRRCRVEAEAPTYTSRGAPAASPSGTSETADGASAQDALRIKLQERKKLLRATSRQSTSPTSDRVIPLASGSRT